EERDGGLQLTPAWISRDMNRAEPPVVANGVVFAYGSGENTTQATPDLGLRANQAEVRIRNSTHAVLHALDAQTGDELWSSGAHTEARVRAALEARPRGRGEGGARADTARAARSLDRIPGIPGPGLCRRAVRSRGGDRYRPGPGGMGATLRPGCAARARLARV